MDVDTLVATLMSLGFDFDGCQLAIAEGNSTVEAAVEWLLNEGSSKSKTVEETAIPGSESSKNDKPSQCRSPLPAEDDSAEHVVSRYATDESQKKAQEEFEQKKRDEIQRDAKKRRLIASQVRQEILQQFREDRAIANSRRTGKKPSSEKTDDAATSDTASTTSDAASTTSDTASKDLCRLKIRLSNGKNVIERCQSSETLLVVIQRIKQIYNESDNLDVIQPFPHRKFSDDDLQQSLVTLGLIPGGCIVLKRLSCSTGQDERGEDVVTASEDVRESDVSHEQEEHENEAPEREDDILGENEIGHDIELADQEIRRHQHAWGAGLSLGRHPYNPHAIDPVIHAESAAEAAEARSRLQTVHDRVQVKLDTDPVSHPSHDVSTLVDTCIKDIATRLPGHHHPVGSLAPLSHRLCLKILRYLMNKKTLTPKTLNCFVPCQLQQLALDHYLYVTNELFHTIRLFKSLTHLSVKSCTVFTDKALEAIAGLKKIIHLDFSNCTQLTNKCLKHLKMHNKNLETLKLDNTKVSDEGLGPFFKDSDWNKLHILSLSKTSVSNVTLEVLQARNLKELHLEQSNVSELQALTSLTNLIYLNVGGTRITNQSLLCLRNNLSLKKLNLHQTQVTDQGLKHLAGLQLAELRLPDRLNVTDIGIAYLQGLPLASLDLTDYVKIRDETLRTVGEMTRLTRLSLSKTKISDNGMQLLSGLVNLKELDLERTGVGDDGLDVLSYLVQLEELNLSGTRITDKCLTAGKLNMLTLLCKLNLSRTNISDVGVANLKLPQLTLLNLDWTSTTEHCPNLLEGCPQLQALRRQNCGRENHRGEV